MRLPNGYGSVTKLSGKRRKPFAVRITTGWTDDGKQQYKYLGYFEKKADAIQALAEYHANPYDLSNKDITFAEVFEKWSVSRFEQISRQAISNYKGSFKHCSTLHRMAMRDIKAAHLQAVIDNCGLTKKSASHIRSLMRQIFNYAVENDIVEKNYADFVKLTKTEKLPPARKTFTQEEINKLWDNLNNYDYADVPLILIYSGMRINELFNIKKADVHLDKKYMVGGLKTEAGRNRIIPISDKILPIITERMNKDGEYLIMSRRGKKMQYTFFNQDIWKKLMAGLEMEHTSHDCRATFASLIDRTDANRLTVKRILGHADEDITEHYIHKDINDLLEAVNKI